MLVNLDYKLLFPLLKNLACFSLDWECTSPLKVGGYKINFFSHHCWELFLAFKGIFREDVLLGLGPLHGRRSYWWTANPASQALAVLPPCRGKALGSGEEWGCRQPGCFLDILGMWSSGSAWGFWGTAGAAGAETCLPCCLPQHGRCWNSSWLCFCY